VIAIQMPISDIVSVAKGASLLAVGPLNRAQLRLAPEELSEASVSPFAA
jgi:hypothetical protein